MLSQNTQINSFKFIFIMAVVFITTSTLFIVFVIHGFIDYKQKKVELIKLANTYSDIVIQQLLYTDKLNHQAEIIASLKSVEVIENSLIFSIDQQSNQKQFILSYNKVNALPISLNNNVIKNYTSPNFNSDGLIFCKESKAYFICLRLNLNSLEVAILNSFYIKLMTLLGSIIFALFLAFYLQKKLTTPIQQLANIFKYIAKEKDYSIRAPNQNIDELNSLSNSFNTMLDRIEHHLKQQKNAEAEILKLNQNLEEKIYQRTEALKDSNKELMDAVSRLHEYQNQLVENQKMASLGDMVAGIAHEVNTPIGLGITASTLMIDKLTNIIEVLEQKKLTQTHLVQFLNESKENLDIIYRNLHRSAELISSFKQLAVNQVQESNQKLKLALFLNDVFLALKPTVKQHTLKIECENTLEAVIKPGIFQQIITNLVMNSVIHGFENVDKGIINIQIYIQEQELIINYKDNGKGISEALKKKIFDPFVTTKRGKGGSGLGMNLVYNLVTQGLKGTIKVESELGHGIRFIIKIPQ
ncbi:HAMP domain-containing histidine kinase [Catenovulum sp. 2E275]|uniref:sensor histidine kinase n=1 Tax=Catenovulum sp. 2E275 TaxID=2980497 RepID=UPI0021D11513|nr:HAMP domain-containing sensor histidine kinase [Catenovulum sp. 2E275]MCU4675588.1 HAMP domain-containing histidine kinase [Catenovulum sp. 2E275]